MSIFCSLFFQLIYNNNILAYNITLLLYKRSQDVQCVEDIMKTVGHRNLRETRHTRCKMAGLEVCMHAGHEYVC